MVEFKSISYITCDDVEELTGVHWNEFEFAVMAENDSYQTLCCADWYLEELYEEFEDVTRLMKIISGLVVIAILCV